MRQRIRIGTAIAVAVLAVATAHGQGTTPQTGKPAGESGGVREPPPQAYEDCKGKKAGDTVQHMTREGKVAATCAESPKGLVARPVRPKGPDAGKAPADR